jgi:hypothetical protein
VEPAGGERTTVALITDPTVTTFTDHFPVANTSTTYWIRQLENRVGEQVESRWTRSTVVPDHEHWFIKDVDEPGAISLRFHVYAQDEPTYDINTDVESYRPLGARTSVHYPSRERSRKGQLTVRLIPGDAVLVEQLAAIEALIEQRKTVCLLSRRPYRKRFCVLTNISVTSSDLPWEAVYELDWEETSYSEGIYERDAFSVRTLIA